MPMNPHLDPGPFHFPGGPVGCLLIHGFTGAPPEMRPMGEYLAARGLTVRGVRLAGHGTTVEDMARTGWRDWVASAEEGLEALRGECQQVFVAGLSLGGLLTLHLGANHPVDGLVVMAPALYVTDWRIHLTPILKHFVKFDRKPEEQDLADPAALNLLWFYDEVPVACAAELRAFMGLVRRELKRITAPTLIMQGRLDRSVSLKGAPTIYERIASQVKRLVWLEGSGHAITVDAEKERVWEEAYRFIAEVAGLSSG